jgi:dihydroneopterin aldolase
VDTISIEGLRVFGRHGLYAEEREHGQDLLIDLELEADLTGAASTDQLDATVDYKTLIDEVVGVVTETSYCLLEALADNIASVVLKHQRVEGVSVGISKPAVAVENHLDRVRVLIRRRR